MSYSEQPKVLKEDLLSHPHKFSWYLRQRSLWGKQDLLGDRFKKRVHRKTREGGELEVARRSKGQGKHFSIDVGKCPRLAPTRLPTVLNTARAQMNYSALKNHSTAKCSVCFLLG